MNALDTALIVRCLLPAGALERLDSWFPREGGEVLAGTVALLERYDDRLRAWASAPDNGQAEAINRGFSATSGEVMAWLRHELPADVTVTNGAGNFTVWPNKFMLYGPHARLLGPQSGAMGYGLPAALAAKAADPDRMVVCFAGDGDLQMVVGELGTAAQHGLQPIVMVIDNAMYGTIRMHQERRHPGRVIGTDIVNPDFVMLGTAYGFHSERVTTTAAFPDAFRRAAASPTGALLHLVVDPQMLTPRLSVQQARG